MSSLMIKVAACLALCISAAFSDASMPLSPGGPNEKTAIYSLSSADGQVQPASDRPKSKAKKIALKRFPDGPIAFRNYKQAIHPIEGYQTKLLPGWTFNFDNVIVTPDAEVITRITERNVAAFKWELEKRKARKRGRYIVEATLPETRPGIVAAPLWLYSEGAREGAHEFDFELMNGRIEYNLHNGNGGFNMRRVNKDLGGHRVRFEIDRRPNKVTMRIESLTDGFKDELVVTPTKVRKWAKVPGAPKNLRWPPNQTAMYPVMEFWVSNASDWAGKWQPLPPGESIEMVMHGYSFTEE